MLWMMAMTDGQFRCIERALHWVWELGEDGLMHTQLSFAYINMSIALLLAGCCVLVAVEEELPDLLNQSCFGRPFITAKSDKQWFQLGMEEGLHYSLKCLTIQDKSGNLK